MTPDVDAMFSLLQDIYESTGDKINGACPVCSTYTHKHWCWYPALLRILHLPLDEFDKTFLEKQS